MGKKANDTEPPARRRTPTSRKQPVKKLSSVKKQATEAPEIKLQAPQATSMEFRTEWVFTNTRLQKYWPWHPDFVVRETFLNDEECDAVIRLADDLTPERSLMKWGSGEEYNRDTDVFWVYASKITYHLFAKIAEHIAEVNEQKFNFDLFGHLRAMQLGRYGVGQAYDYHQDLGKFASSKRKLSFCIQLTSPTDYEGGTLEFFRSARSAAPCSRKRGTIVVFPSWMMHRVTAITKGIRWSLVGWVEGPPFR